MEWIGSKITHAKTVGNTRIAPRSIGAPAVPDKVAPRPNAPGQAKRILTLVECSWVR